MANPLQNYRILLVDGDYELGQVLRTMLVEMGFRQVRLLRSGREALQTALHRPPDFIITERKTEHINGLTLVKTIRRDHASPQLTLPIMLMSGKAEQDDVVQARDVGINEYLIKPFSVQSIYNRLERMIEQPRHFVISQHFTGPDRRGKDGPPPGVAERRVRKIMPELRARSLYSFGIHDSTQPHIFLPDFSLKMKLGPRTTLKSLITPAVLQTAQAAIDAITDESLNWVKENLNDIKRVLQSLKDGELKPEMAPSIAESALFIHNRAGTFGYGFAAKVSYMLYLFCQNQMQPENAQHHIVVEKHVEVLQVILGNNMHGDAGDLGYKVTTELRALTDKYAA